jgi:chromosome segregation ATPase
MRRPAELLATAEDVAALTAELNRAHRTAELATARAEALQAQVGVLTDRVRTAEHRTELANAQADALRARLNTDEQAALARALAACQIYEDRLAVFEGRPSRIECPRACCAPTPAGDAA